VLQGYNDLATTSPNIAAEWHPSRNHPLKPTELTAGSNSKVWWMCGLGHEWITSVNERKQGTGCPYCSNAKVLAGYNDLKTLNPLLSAEWHPTKNSPLSPTEIGAGSGKNVWWRCQSGHEWRAKVVSRNLGAGCAVCSGKSLQIGLNDLATTHPNLAEEWHPTNNGIITPSNVINNGHRAVWWRCALGHEWKATIKDRKQGTDCPYCANRKVMSGYNDLGTVLPEIAAYWHPTRNLPLTPERVAPKSHKKFWWQCEKGHEWQATPSNSSRADRKGCPYCGNYTVLEGFNDFETLQPTLAAEWHPTHNLPDLPSQFLAGSHKRFWWRCEFGHEWKTQIAERVNGTGCPSCASYGFDPSKPADFYFIEHISHRAYKVGITNAETRRLAKFGKQGWETIHIVHLPDGHKVRKLEAQVLTWIRQDAKLPPFLGRKDMRSAAGWTETFARDEIDEERVLQKIRETCDALAIPFGESLQR
jgi:hypothetical protein